MNDTIPMKKAFLKNIALSIPILKEPYFTDRLQLLERQFGAYSKWIQFQEDIKAYATEKEFFLYSNGVRDKAIEFIKKQQAYSSFIESDLRKVYPFQKLKGIPITPYEMRNDGKYCLSIDLKSGNYNALRFVNPLLVGETKTYEEFISEYTNIESLKSSKQIRQNIFGHLKNDHIVYIENYLIHQFLAIVMEHFEKENVLAFAKDEIVIDITNNVNKVIILSKKLKEKAEELDIPISIETFKLKGIYIVRNEEKIFTNYFLKDMGKGKVEFKNIHPIYLPFVLRAYYGEDVTEYDKTFLFEENIVHFNENIQILLPDKVVSNLDT